MMMTLQRPVNIANHRFCYSFSSVCSVVVVVAAIVQCMAALVCLLCFVAIVVGVNETDWHRKCNTANATGPYGTTNSGRPKTVDAAARQRHQHRGTTHVVHMNVCVCVCARRGACSRISSHLVQIVAGVALKSVSGLLEER